MNVFLFYGKIYHISFANRQIYQEKNMIDLYPIHKFCD